MINFVDGKQSWRLLVRALRCLVDSGQDEKEKPLMLKNSITLACYAVNIFLNYPLERINWRKLCCSNILSVNVFIFRRLRVA